MENLLTTALSKKAAQQVIDQANQILSENPLLLNAEMPKVVRAESAGNEADLQSNIGAITNHSTSSTEK